MLIPLGLGIVVVWPTGGAYIFAKSLMLLGWVLVKEDERLEVKTRRKRGIPRPIKKRDATFMSWIWGTLAFLVAFFFAGSLLEANVLGTLLGGFLFGLFLHLAWKSLVVV